MVIPSLITEGTFQAAWLTAARRVMAAGWDTWNLAVHIENPSEFSEEFNEHIEDFANRNDMLGPKHVCYTIFPYNLYEASNNRADFYSSYNDRFFPRTQRHLRNWGTYFHRMIAYRSTHAPVNQLENIINAINDRTATAKAAYTIVVERPGSETVRKMGAPCLNYIAVQSEPGTPRRIGLLAVYRNHDFLERAYGNYWGLCRLLAFICNETDSTIGPVTCISSHAYVPDKRTAFRIFIQGLA